MDHPLRSEPRYSAKDIAHLDDLAQRYQQGDMTALSALYHEFADWLTHTIRRAALRRSDISVMEMADLHQEAFIIVSSLVLRWQPQSGVNFAGYFVNTFPWALGRVIRTNNLDQRSKHVAVRSEAHDTVVLRLHQRPSDDGRYWADSIFWRDVLDALPESERAVLWLHAVECYSLREIATAWGCPRSTVFDLYRRVVQKTRKELFEEAA